MYKRPTRYGTPQFTVCLNVAAKLSYRANPLLIPDTKGMRHQRHIGRSSQRGRKEKNRDGSKSAVPRSVPTPMAVTFVYSVKPGIRIEAMGRKRYPPMNATRAARRGGRTAKSPIATTIQPHRTT
jgi:hypothetical protein